MVLSKKETLEDLKTSKYHDLEDMVYRFQLTNDEILDALDLKYIPTTTIGYTVPPGMYGIIDFDFILKFLIPKEAKVEITVDGVRLRSILTTKKIIRFTKKSFFYIILGFKQPGSGELGDIPGFIQLVPGSYKSDKPINITGVDKVHFKYDCIEGNIVNGFREKFFHSFGPSPLHGHKIYTQRVIKIFKKEHKSFI